MDKAKYAKIRKAARQKIAERDRQQNESAELGGAENEFVSFSSSEALIEALRKA